MPYVDAETQERLEFDVPGTPGELNYVLTHTVLKYLEGHDALNYQLINDIVGALESAKMEFYRKVAVPYEDNKAWKNPDPYSPWRPDPRKAEYTLWRDREDNDNG